MSKFLDGRGKNVARTLKSTSHNAKWDILPNTELKITASADIKDAACIIHHILFRSRLRKTWKISPTEFQAAILAGRPSFEYLIIFAPHKYEKFLCTWPATQNGSLYKSEPIEHIESFYFCGDIENSYYAPLGRDKRNSKSNMNLFLTDFSISQITSLLLKVLNSYTLDSSFCTSLRITTLSSCYYNIDCTCDPRLPKKNQVTVSVLTTRTGISGGNRQDCPLYFTSKRNFLVSLY